MNIIICVKQVPGTTKVEVDPVTGVLKRDGVAAKLNPYDLFAIESSLKIKEKLDGCVHALSMGPNQAIASLKETIWMGADDAYLLSDRKFAGADVHATAYAISEGISTIGNYDLIICGKQTTDGDTAQVGPEVAEMLGIDHATNVLDIVDVDEKSITVTLNLDNIIQTQKMSLPCLITMEKDVNTPRLPSYKRKKSINTDEKIKVLSAADLIDIDEKRLGLSGSPTRVEKIFPPEKNSDKVIYDGSSAELSDKLYSLLADKKFI